MNKPCLLIVSRYVLKQPQILLISGLWQYKILHRILPLPVNYYLKMIKAFTVEVESETKEHVFVNCKHSLPLWS